MTKNFKMATVEHQTKLGWSLPGCGAPGGCTGHTPRKLALAPGVQFAENAIVSRLAPFPNCGWGCHICRPSEKSCCSEWRCQRPHLLHQAPQVPPAPSLPLPAATKVLRELWTSGHQKCWFPGIIHFHIFLEKKSLFYQMHSSYSIGYIEVEFYAKFIQGKKR